MPTADIRAYVLRNVMETAMAYSVHSSVEPPGIVGDRREEGKVTVDQWVIRRGRRTAEEQEERHMREHKHEYAGTGVFDTPLDAPI
jgi:hypothetical protein